MKTPVGIRLPIAEQDYSFNNETIFRRTAESTMENLRVDIQENEEKRSTTGSLALRRYQFLLMGAS